VLENLRFRFGFVSGFSFRLAKQTQTQKPTKLENELEPGSKVCKTAREILSVYLGTPIPIPSRFLRAAESLLRFLFRFGPTSWIGFLDMCQSRRLEACGVVCKLAGAAARNSGK